MARREAWIEERVGQDRGQPAREVLDVRHELSAERVSREVEIEERVGLGVRARGHGEEREQRDAERRSEAGAAARHGFAAPRAKV